MIVADTDVISELMKAQPSSAVLAWVTAHGRDDVRITAVTVAEILYGIERLPNGKRKAGLRQAATGIFDRFAKDVLPFDLAAATVYPIIVDHRERQGVPISGYDAQIAAICRTNGARLATRNERDFAGVGVEIMNPWTSA